MNVLLIVIDAFDQTRIEESNYVLTPNLERLLTKGFKFTNVYSQAPYTEAAVMSLYAGQNTLDSGGYLYRFGNAKKTIFECFHDAGYDVFFNSHQPQVFPSSQRKGIDCLFYGRPYDFDVLWRYRLQYYSSLYLGGQLSDCDLRVVCDFVEDNFKEAKAFLNDFLGNDKKLALLKKANKTFDANSALNRIQAEYNSFSKNKKRYCLEILSKGKDHGFFKIPVFDVCDFDLPKEIETIQNKEAKRICKRITRMNFFNALFKNEDLFKSSIRSTMSFIKNHNKTDFLKAFYMIKNSLFMTHIRDRYGHNARKLKGQPSFNALADNFLEWIDSRKDRSKPFFACVHADDVHFPEVFYSYDSPDVSVVKKELQVANELLDKKIKRKGTIIHDLSIAYADYRVGQLLEKLDEKGVLEDTIVYVTADHGFSYSGYPIRSKDINTFYLENFKIPLYVFNKSAEGKKVISSLLSSVDVPSTICDVAGIERPQSFVGGNAFEKNRDVLFIEYCGGGCPDLSRREIMLSAFDGSKMLCFKAKLDQEFGWNRLVEAYDLKADPKQRKNVFKVVNKEDYKYLYLKAESRFLELKKEQAGVSQKMSDLNQTI